MSFTNLQIIKRFAEAKLTCPGSAGNVFYRGDDLYSYGTHFRLAIRKKFGKGVEFLVNGDVYSPSTSKHTSLVIQNCRPNVQIPFSALYSADILPGGIQIIDWSMDKSWYTCPKCGREVAGIWEGMPHKDDRTPICLDDDGEPSAPKWNHILGSVIFKYENKTYLSSTDEQEKGRTAYFLCMLPKNVRTINDAYEVLIPKIVKEAIGAGVDVKRQGDYYFIPTTIENSLETKRPKNSALILRDERIEKSSHVASFYVKMHRIIYVRGTIFHSPIAREGTHKNLYLKNVWHVPVKNMAVQGWTARGNVD